MASLDARSTSVPGLLLILVALVAACKGGGSSGY
jgi:hypothetical protein